MKSLKGSKSAAAIPPALRQRDHSFFAVPEKKKIPKQNIATVRADLLNEKKQFKNNYPKKPIPNPIQAVADAAMCTTQG